MTEIQSLDNKPSPLLDRFPLDEANTHTYLEQLVHVILNVVYCETRIQDLELGVVHILGDNSRCFRLSRKVGECHYI